MDLGRRLSIELGFTPKDRFGSFRPILVDGQASSYEPFRGTARIGLAD